MVLQQHCSQAVLAGVPRMNGQFIQDFHNCRMAGETVPLDFTDGKEGEAFFLTSLSERQFIVNGDSFGTVFSDQGDPAEIGPQGRRQQGGLQWSLIFNKFNKSVGQFYFRFFHLYPAFPGPVLVGFLFDFQEEGIRIHVFPEPDFEPGPGTVMVGQVKVQVLRIIIQGIVLKSVYLPYLQQTVLIHRQPEKIFQLGGVKYEFRICAVHQFDSIHFPE